MALAGLWESWEYPGGRPARNLHHPDDRRQQRHAAHPPPHAGDPARRRLEIVAGIADAQAEQLTSLLQPCPPEILVAHPVSRKVNRPDFDHPECLDPIWDDPGGQLNLFG